jgi:aryl-alcohol dehydrogenase-like predicted oxidoreductase
MLKLTLGQTSISTSALALGCARLGSALTPLSRRECVALIDTAYELGVRHFDTASIYGQGDSERYIGEALAKRRGEVCLSSKAGQLLSTKQQLLAHFKTPIRWIAARRGAVRGAVADQRARGVPRCFEADYIERSLHDSLRRLRTDHLDIFYLHSPSVTVLEDAGLWERLERLRERGLFRALGVSGDEAEVADRAATLPGVQVVQFGSSKAAHDIALMSMLNLSGKSGVVRGLISTAGNECAGGLTHRIARTLELPALGGIILGTTSVKHLKENIASFARAAEGHLV